MKVQDVISQLQKVIIASGNLDLKIRVADTYVPNAKVDICIIGVDDNSNECIIVI